MEEGERGRKISYLSIFSIPRLDVWKCGQVVKCYADTSLTNQITDELRQSFTAECPVKNGIYLTSHVDGCHSLGAN